MKNLTLCCSLGLLLMAAPAVAQKPAPAAAVPKGAHPRSKAEGDALKALQSLYKSPTATGDQIDAAITSFVTQFPTSDYIATVSSWGLQFYQDPAHAGSDSYNKSLLYGEQAIKANPKDVLALSVIGDIIPNQAKATDLDFDQRMTEATSDDNAVIQLAQTEDTVNGQPFTAALKSQVQGTAYNSLARIATLEDKDADAVTNYQKAITFDDSSHQAYDYFYMARAQMNLRQYDAALASLDACAKADPTNPAVQAAVTSNRKAIAELKKGGGL